MQKIRTFDPHADHPGARDRIKARARDTRRIGKESKVTGYILRVKTRDEEKIEKTT